MQDVFGRLFPYFLSTVYIIGTFLQTFLPGGKAISGKMLGRRVSSFLFSA